MVPREHSCEIGYCTFGWRDGSDGRERVMKGEMIAGSRQKRAIVNWLVED